MSEDLLVELGCEDLPARYVMPLATELGQLALALTNRGVANGGARIFATPRRLAVLVERVPKCQADQQIERRGPALNAAYKNGEPTPAALGFAKSCGVEFAQLEKIETDKGAWLVFRGTQRGKRTIDLIPELFEERIKAMDVQVPKRMRWGSGEETFVRPVQWITALLGEEVISLSRFGLDADKLTYGHRFHAPQAIALRCAADYEPKLREAKVLADFTARRAVIRTQVEAEAARLGGQARMTDELLDEVTALIEWPVTISGRMEPRFMALPPEVIIATIEHNQRYFPVFAADGKLLPFFITVSNIESRDVSQVIAGNERVVRPRLSDALFFWEQDLKRPLAAYADRLADITYLKGLGSLADKSVRLTKLAETVAGLAGLDADAARRAAALCKCDLVTRMVYEFPELQGLMGGYYARAAGETDAVAAAIAEHYQPAGAGAAIPASTAGCVVALADKLDLLAGIFATGQKPTAAKDPLGARRAALGILRILIEGDLDLDVRALIAEALAALPVPPKAADASADIVQFLTDRLRALFVDRGAPADAVEAVLALDVRRPLDLARRLKAVERFRALPESVSLAAANKRTRNILKQAGEGSFAVFQSELCRESAEQVLAAALVEYERKAEPLLAGGDYTETLKTLAGLRAPVDGFFDGVMVMCEDTGLRANRIALLKRLSDLFLRVADISKLQAAA